ncbi:unnamed protein product [Pedinophyceae sp. YPF-701]|nr:unnamed protein product [Pedinophyceae sp. YPF-701]
MWPWIDRKESPAQKMNRALVGASITSCKRASVAGDVARAGLRVAGAPPLLQDLSPFLDVVTGSFKPKGVCGCDHSPLDRAFNIATAVPYVMSGWEMLRNRETSAGRFFGASLIFAGASAVAYHASWGKARTIARKLDYWSISAGATAMSFALFPSLPRQIRTASYLATPFEPFKTSFVHATAMELEFARRAAKNPKLRASQALHLATTVAGMACFSYESYKPETKYVHGVWHICSAIAVSQLGRLVADVEAEVLSTPGFKGNPAPFVPEYQYLHNKHHPESVRRASLSAEIVPLSPPTQPSIQRHSSPPVKAG